MNSEVTPANSLLAGKGTSLPSSPSDLSDTNAFTSPEEARLTPTNNLRKIPDRTISVKDFAYDLSHPLHYGALDQGQDSESDYDDYNYDDYDYNYDESLILDNDHATPDNDNNNNFSENDNNVEDLVHAIALYSFQPENENELELVEDQLIIINYEYGDGWLVAHDPYTEETGLIPSEYIHILTEEELEEASAATAEADVIHQNQVIVETTVVSSNGDKAIEADNNENEIENEDGFIDDSISTAKPFLPSILQDSSTINKTNNVSGDDENQWEDYDSDSDDEYDLNKKKNDDDGYGVLLAQKVKNMQI